MVLAAVVSRGNTNRRGDNGGTGKDMADEEGRVAGSRRPEVSLRGGEVACLIPNIVIAAGEGCCLLRRSDGAGNR